MSDETVYPPSFSLRAVSLALKFAGNLNQRARYLSDNRSSISHARAPRGNLFAFCSANFGAKEKLPVRSLDRENTKL